MFEVNVYGTIVRVATAEEARDLAKLAGCHASKKAPAKKTTSKKTAEKKAPAKKAAPKYSTRKEAVDAWCNEKGYGEEERSEYGTQKFAEGLARRWAYEVASDHFDEWVSKTEFKKYYNTIYKKAEEAAVELLVNRKFTTTSEIQRDFIVETFENAGSWKKPAKLIKKSKNVYVLER